MSKLIEYGERLMRVADRAQGAAGFGTTANFQIELANILNEVIGDDDEVNPHHKGLDGIRIDCASCNKADNQNKLRRLQRERAGL